MYLLHCNVHILDNRIANLYNGGIFIYCHFNCPHKIVSPLCFSLLPTLSPFLSLSLSLSLILSYSIRNPWIHRNRTSSFINSVFITMYCIRNILGIYSCNLPLRFKLHSILSYNWKYVTINTFLGPWYLNIWIYTLNFSEKWRFSQESGRIRRGFGRNVGI